MDDILDLCRVISAQGEYHAMFNYSGHVNAVSVSVYHANADWNDKENPPEQVLYTPLATTTEQLINITKELKEFLK